jgi:uncharacterized protein (TIGR03067 family)
MRTTTLLAAVALALAFAPAPFPRPTRRDTKESDLTKMQGRWVRVKMTIGGRPGAQNTPVTVAGERMQFPAADDAWTITLDVTKRPKQIDLRRISNPKQMFRGVYRFDGDTLTICWRMSPEEKQRPTEFSEGGEGVWFQVYKRQEGG